MNRRPTLSALIEYLGIRFVYLFYGLIPAKRAYDIGFAFTASLYPLFRKRRKIAIDNILQARITDDPAEADRIARHAFGHLAGHVCESIKVGKVINAANWREHITFDGPEESWKLLMESPGIPLMILTGHHGVWEASVPIISITRPMIAVARKMNNPFVDRFLKRNHFRSEITIIPKSHGFTPDVLRTWKKKGAVMAIVMDQHAGPVHGIKVDFMGRPASTHTSPARLHLKSGAPVLVGSLVRESAFHYRIVTDAPLRFTPSGDKEKDTTDLLTEINRRLEKIIRRYPEQYLWAHKRWR